MLWVISLSVDSVDDPGELVGVFSDNGLQAKAASDLDFSGIGGAHGCDSVGGYDGTFHQVDTTVVCDETFVFWAQIKHIAQCHGIKFSLIFQVMNGEHRADLAVIEAGFQVDGYQSRVPVVGVDDIGVKSGKVHNGEDGFREKGKALPVVEVTIGFFPVEVIPVVYELVGYTVTDHLKHAAVDLPPGELHRGLA